MEQRFPLWMAPVCTGTRECIGDGWREPEAVLQEEGGRAQIGTVSTITAKKAETAHRMSTQEASYLRAVVVAPPMSPRLYLLTFSCPLPLSFQGICSKMCFLCLPYPPCPGRNTSPGSRGCVILRLCPILPPLTQVLGHIRSGQKWPCSAFHRDEEY